MLAVTWSERSHAPLLKRHPYLLSVKHDGVRASWDGHHLHTRKRHRIHAPSEWLRQLPPTPLEGELYIDRGKFGEVSGLVGRTRPVPEAWQGVKYLVFDSPASHATFAHTYADLRTLLPTCTSTKQVCCLLPQRPATSVAQVKTALKNELAKGGEGVMLRRADVPYRAGRTAALIKVKGGQDAEAVVVGYHSGKGRLSKHLGALRCAWVHDPSVQFKVGAGFSDAMRRDYKHRFSLGTLITVKFMSLDPKSGRPRHPVLKGVRHDL